jgi:hypothetical protein
MAGMTIGESAACIGALVWTERRLFELLGGWVPTTPEPEVKVVLSRRSRHHGEHALALVALLPDTRDHEPDALILPRGDAPRALEAAAGSSATKERLAAAGDVVAGHLDALEAYLAAASPVRDAPGIRAVTAVLAEDRFGLEDVRGLLAR